MSMNPFRHRLRFLAAAVGACIGLGASQAALAQSAGYPNRPVKVIVPFPAGGLVDGIARTLMTAIGAEIKQSIVIDNRGGAGGSVGAAAAAQSPADGYTLLMVLDTHAINPLVYKKLAYDNEKDFAPISLIARAPMVAVANEKVPVNSLGELVKYAKAQPDAINYGSVGPGSASHLTAEMFNMKAGIKTTHIPYKGGAPAQTDLMAGQIQIMWGTAPYAQSLVRAGKTKALGQASAARSVAFPDLPTAAEQGIKDFEAYGWVGLLAPAGTPADIIRFWNEQLKKAANSAEVGNKLREQGFELVLGSPADFGKFIRSETQGWQQLIKARNIPLE
ncbi:tripartite tricarboxylate transporter substrate binding protein [Ramlibacter tataouinensis]|uniref:tripartite tricarboxylate transporter substrate binding protein n=1 Tax=Ramlibacter tataouinensis TaxID=94132 RepID=UPI0022F402B4|nr:tripartite tricarboxylate transporter substrate binding protein [Ramlibacter tataouinensis]WBY01432.1 tripartite tricarboxylate transporter substrate binding protein [Ramlibacter tataouinensis]